MVGYIAVLVGFGYLVLYQAIIEPNLPYHSFGAEDLWQLMVGTGIGMTGLFVLAFGELIKVFVDVERNTRKN
ncbi:MAG: hypothetical protein EXQ83_15385 [Xanthobacteraceae bacterium]|nr:hypothetical protein [Xanthobacteraceae bacterium]